MVALTIGPEVPDRTASEAGISLAAAAEIGTPSEEVRGVPADTTDRALVPAAVAVAPAWVEAEASEVVAGDAGR